MAKKAFFDIHCHFFNLSHIGFLAFVNRFLLDKSLDFKFFINDKLLKILSTAAFLIFVMLSASLLIINFKVRIVFFSVITAAASVFLFRVLFKLNFRNIINMLSVLESDIGSVFLLIEKDYLLNGSDVKKKVFHYENNKKAVSFNRVVLTPLLIDFNNKGFKGIKEIYYGHAPKKPVVQQVRDIYNGIRSYKEKSHSGLLEIYPFLGINPENYFYGIDSFIQTNNTGLDIKIYKKIIKDFPGKISEKFEFFKDALDSDDRGWVIIVIEELLDHELKIIEKILKSLKNRNIASDIERISLKSKENSVVKILYKYFGDYSKTDAKEKRFEEKFEEIFNRNNQWNGDIEKIRSYFFSGIKLYPLLDFDPYPENDLKDSRKKVELIYQFCSKKNIPITVHCQITGFSTSKNSVEYVNPEKWFKIFSQDKFRNLKVNFAHMGIDYSDKKGISKHWVDNVILLIKNYPNVYADFAYKGVDMKFYGKLQEIVKNNPEIKKRILFGTDFMMQLFENKSYNEYISNFFKDEYLSLNDKMLYCSENPHEFLFG